MSSNLKVYRVQFHADIGKLLIKTPIACQITATWKRSAEVAKTTTIEFSNGQANFDQAITIPVNMYYEEATCTFQEKKSLFSFTLHTPKGEKTAGTVSVDLAQMLNNKLETYEENYKLEKCPDKEARVFIRIRAELIGEQNPDSMSHISGISANLSTSTSMLDNSLLNTLSVSKDNPAVFASTGSNKASAAANPLESSPGPLSAEHQAEITALRQELETIKQEKQTLATQLQSVRVTAAAVNSIPQGGDEELRNEVIKLTEQLNFLKAEMQKSKAIQDKLERQLNQNRTEQQDHEKDLQSTRIRLQQVYSQLTSSLGSYL